MKEAFQDIPRIGNSVLSSAICRVHGHSADEKAMMMIVVSDFVDGNLLA